MQYRLQKSIRITQIQIHIFHLNKMGKNLLAIKGVTRSHSKNKIPELLIQTHPFHISRIILLPIHQNTLKKTLLGNQFRFCHFLFIPDNSETVDIKYAREKTTIFSIHVNQIKQSPFRTQASQNFLNSYNEPRKLFVSRKQSDKSTKRKQKILFITHNLNIEGAPKVLFEIASAMVKTKRWQPIIFSQEEGPLSQEFEDLNIPIHLVTEVIEKSMADNCYDLKQKKFLATIHILDQINPDIVFANTIVSSIAIAAAYERKIPAVWMIHESSYPSPIQNMQSFCAHAENLKAFLTAENIVFCAQSTMDVYKKFDFNGRFNLVKNAPSTSYESVSTSPELKLKAKAILGIPSDNICLLNIGVIHENKNQLLIIKALQHINNKNVHLLLIGARNNSPYLDKIKETVINLNLEKQVSILSEDKNVHPYYQAADIYILPSRSESYPLTILEAMSFSLPILCTAVFGMNEQVKFNVNAYPISPDNENDLAGKIAILINDPGKRKQMGKKSKQIIDSLPKHRNMIEEHIKIIEQSQKHL